MLLFNAEVGISTLVGKIYDLHLDLRFYLLKEREHSLCNGEVRQKTTLCSVLRNDTSRREYRYGGRAKVVAKSGEGVEYIRVYGKS